MVANGIIMINEVYVTADICLKVHLLTVLHLRERGGWGKGKLNSVCACARVCTGVCECVCLLSIYIQLTYGLGGSDDRISSQSFADT